MGAKLRIVFREPGNGHLVEVEKIQRSRYTLIRIIKSNTKLHEIAARYSCCDIRQQPIAAVVDDSSGGKFISVERRRDYRGDSSSFRSCWTCNVTKAESVVLIVQLLAPDRVSEPSSAFRLSALLLPSATGLGELVVEVPNHLAFVKRKPTPASGQSP